MLYDRKIKYFEYRKKGERISGAGFLKLEVRDKICNIWIQISGLNKTDTFTKTVILQGNHRREELCRLDIQNGAGSLQLQLPAEDLCRRITYEQLETVTIPISAETELYCEVKVIPQIMLEETEREWLPEPAKEEAWDRVENEAGRLPWEAAEELQEEEIQKVHGGRSGKLQEEETGELQGEETGELRREESRELQREGERELRGEGAREPQLEETGELQREESRELLKEEIEKRYRGKAEEIHGEGPRELSEEEPRELQGEEPGKLPGEKMQKLFWEGSQEAIGNETPLKMMEDKWKQLAAIYPHIKPFEDERDYLKIGPQDFVVLSAKSYRLTHNSFLLHGYYNYSHLIMDRYELRGEMRYYIGVPGNFYDREKQVAVMFGFESFECREEPANNGDFGYYMIRVDI